MKAAALLVVSLLAGLAVSAGAHHTFIAQYDPDQPVSLTGIVTKVEWTNPHVWFYINVEDEASGDVVNWGAEMGPPHGLQRSGWRRDSLKIGERVTVEGFLARNGSNRLNARAVTLAATGQRPGATLDANSSSQGN